MLLQEQHLLLLGKSTIVFHLLLRIQWHQLGKQFVLKLIRHTFLDLFIESIEQIHAQRLLLFPVFASFGFKVDSLVLLDCKELMHLHLLLMLVFNRNFAE